ncbi:MAG: serine/threonine-protein kinase [Bryobacterales bacterium]|nr:serine/threonine-protein kinase [Bryobacterales bacterium]
MMDAERWARVERLYLRVLDAPPERRTAVLEESCSDDPELLQELESLLEAREQAGPFLSPEQLCRQIEKLGAESTVPGVGSTLGPYRLLAEIGSGAMGEVYRAWDSRLDRPLAVKLLPAAFTHDAERIARFQREAKAASALNHPNIVTIYEIGQVEETWFIAEELIEGVTLRERLSGGPLPVPEAVEIGLQYALALAAAHRAGIVHRDIKPENLMLRPDGVVKIVDFGLARIGEAGPTSPQATQAGSILGTPRYMSPEQARGQRLDRRTDIFSLGSVLYEMVTGLPAFPGTSTAEVFAALLDSVPRAASECVDGIPAHWDVIVSKALEKDRERRYQTMQEFVGDLQNLQHQLRAGSAISISNKRSSTPRGAPPLSRRGILTTGVGTAGALALAWYERAAKNRNPGDTPPPSVVPLTSFAGYKDFGSFSPDGRRIAFSWNGGKGGFGGKPERKIYTKTIGPDEPVQLTFTAEDDRVPAWSPDGKYIAFCRAATQEPTPSRYAVYVIPASGGQERKITEGGMGVSWSEDGKALAVAGASDEAGAIFLFSLETGKRRQLTSPHLGFDNLPVFSPDGRWVAFTRDFGFSAREIFVVPARGGTAKRLTFDREPTYGAAWTADSREIVFASNRGSGGESLWRIATSGGTSTPLLTRPQGGGFYPSISRQGHRLVYTEAFKDTNIYAYDGPGFGSRAAPGPFRGPKGLILSSRRDDSPSISPDGERIAFVSKRTGNEEIWVCDRNGGRLAQLTSFKGPGTGTPRWSPDGRCIAFDSLAAGNPNIYVIKAEGRALSRLTSGPSGNFMPSWSFDGQWVYFKSDRSGSDQIWRVPAMGGAATQVTRSGASEAFPSPDGKLVYFRKRPWGPLWTVPVEGGPEEPLPELQSFDKIFRSWGIIERGIYFLSREETPHQIIRFFSFASRQITPLVALEKEPIWDYPDVALSNDGRRLLYACLDQEINDLMMIENFH